MTRGRKLGLGAALALLLLLVVAAALLGLVPGATGRYHNSTPALAVAYRAKEMCSCLFVEGRDQAYCRAWTVAAPDIARPEVDAAGKAVRARALWLWTARARWMGPGRGCALE